MAEYRRAVLGMILFARGRVLDFSLGAALKIGCDGLCRVTGWV